MNKLKVGDRVLDIEVSKKGTVKEVTRHNDKVYYKVLFDNKNEHLVSGRDLRKLILKSTYKYVLKTQLLDDIYPKDSSKYAKVKVIK